MTIKKPSPYVPAFLKAALEGSRPLQLTFSEVSDTNILSTSSFIYDAADAPLKSTQQLNVDWSKFENHTFFMSAEAKVNLAFEQVINGFPFDGTRAEVESFFEKLTGFDRWVFDNFPKFHGQLMFSGTKVGETLPSGGSYIVVKDAAGSLYPELSKNKTGGSVLNPKGTSLSIEMQLYLPTGSIDSTDTQVICQKLSGSTHGFSLYLTPSPVTSPTVEARFSVISGSYSLTAPCILDRGKFNHICATLNRETSAHYLEFFKGGESNNVTKSRYAFGNFNIDASDFIIGSGSAMSIGNITVTPTQTLSGTIDELRVFHSARSAELQQLYAAKAIFAQPDLKLYYRFNEPPPPLTTLSSDQANAIVIDSSGNSLHSIISNFLAYAHYAPDMLTVTGSSLRQNASLDPTSHVIYEKEETLPVLFPAHPGVVELNSTLLMSASQYDVSNPNLITRLVPQHYLLEGSLFDGFEEPDGDGNKPYGGSGIPGQGKLGNVQLFLSLLYIWARFFDEMKLYVDVFSSLRTVNYNTNTSMPNNFLRDLVREYGFHMPPLFNDSTLEQYIRAENVDQQISNSETPLKHVQNELMRRILINLPDVLRSKGTQHSIKVFLRAIGIDPENSVRLREYGGPTTRQLSYSRENKRETGTMVEFITSSLAISPFLSASRVEPGYPFISGTLVPYVSSTLYSGTFSGSATFVNLGDAYSSSIDGAFPGISFVSGTSNYGFLNGVFSGSQIGSLNITSGSIISGSVFLGALSGTAITGSVQSGTLIQGNLVNVTFTGSFASGTTKFETLPGLNDGLLTSGSWTVESIVKYTPFHTKAMTSATQSLARICVAGDMAGGVGLVANLLAVSSSTDPKLILYLRPGINEASPLLHMSMSIPNNSIFDGDKWNVSFGCVRNDSIDSKISSSYFLRLGNQNNGEIETLLATASFFNERISSESISFRQVDVTFNHSGAFLAVGENNQIPVGTGNSYLYLNNSSKSDLEARVTAFTGLASNLRFWSKALTLVEWTEHVRNHRSLGVEDPLVNYNFVQTRNGSFEKVRLDSLGKQDIRRAITTASLGTTGSITFLDFSLNGLHMTGSGFPIDKDCVKSELFDVSYLSPYFDEAVTNEKVRIRSFLNQDLIDATPWAQTAPVYEIVKSERPTDDVRFSIEFSLIDALNRDIITLFATLDKMDNALGSPELVFSPDYPDLETLRNIYFNRIREKLNFKGFFEFFRWFDTSIGTFIQQLVPKKTNFRGTNFTIESHMLERHKLEYLFNEIYLGESDRNRIRDVLLLQQFVGTLRKY